MAQVNVPIYQSIFMSMDRRIKHMVQPRSGESLKLHYLVDGEKELFHHSFSRKGRRHISVCVWGGCTIVAALTFFWLCGQAEEF